MASKSETGSAAAGAMIQLLDPGSGRPLRSWRLPAVGGPILIGRAEDRDIQIDDPYVSRHHAELHPEAGRWRLVARGRNGVYIQSRGVTEALLTAELTFRLGAIGPLLRFMPGEAPQESLSTCMYAGQPLEPIELDHEQIATEVEEIATGDYFQQLQEKARRMRRGG
jgi:hypothetical protein